MKTKCLKGESKKPTEMKRGLYKPYMDAKISIRFLLSFPAAILSVFLFAICKGEDWLSLLLLILFLPFKTDLLPFFSKFHVFLYFLSWCLSIKRPFRISFVLITILSIKQQENKLKDSLEGTNKDREEEEASDGEKGRWSERFHAWMHL